MINTHKEYVDALEELIREVQKYPKITTERIEALKGDMADFLRRQSMAIGVYADEKDREDQYYRGRPRG